VFAKATDTYTLSNQVRIPCIGYGTWQMPNEESTTAAVTAALEAGYRHIDTAAAYGNEISVGEAIRRSGIDRGDIFITSKLANTDHGYEAARQAFTKTLRLLGTDYLDLYLIHWPNPAAFRDCWEQANAESWRAMEEYYREGRIRAIGVSNFFERHLEALYKTAKIVPMVNQMSLSPGQPQSEIVAYSREHGMLLEAYSPLGTGKVLGTPEMETYARKYGKSVAQISIRWSLQMGFLPLPKSANPGRIQENIQVFDFELSQEDVEAIAKIDCGSVVRSPDTIAF
jgi:diketogulonate reductase-like aldo/keto reductase